MARTGTSTLGMSLGAGLDLDLRRGGGAGAASGVETKDPAASGVSVRTLVRTVAS